MGEAGFTELRPSAGARREAGDGTTIGREDCDIVLGDPEVSRRHAIVRVAGTGAVVEDLGSRNGTFVNGERIAAPATLRAGDTVRFGSTEWRFEGVVGASETAPREAIPQAEPEPPSGAPAEREPMAPDTAPEPPPAAPDTAPEPEPAALAREPRPAEEPAQPPRPAPEPPSAVGASAQRGDVPPPPDPAASAVRAAPASRPDGPPAFAAAGTVGPVRRGSAARSGKATAIALAVVFADAAALVVYFAAR